MLPSMPDFKARSERHQAQMSDVEINRLLDAGRVWNLAPTLQAGGAILFPHATLSVCGHQIAAAVHACLDCGAERVLALGVLHARTEELKSARERVAAGSDPSGEAAWGIQGPGLAGRQDWQAEFSLSHFQFLWREETKRRGIAGPKLILRYPFLTGERPDLLPGARKLEALARGAAVVATLDPVHHGVGYGDAAEDALAPENGGMELARRGIEAGLEILRQGDAASYIQHCLEVRSDGRDVGLLLRHLRGPLRGAVLDLVTDDMSAAYSAPPPTWVAGALITLRKEARTA